MSNPPARVFSVTLYTSFNTSGEDATNHLIDEWSGKLSAEPSLLAYEGGSMSFRIEDLEEPASARYWSNRIQQCVPFTTPAGVYHGLPYVEVYDVSPLISPVAPRPLFTGWVERNQLQWIGDQVTGFTADTQLPYMERLNMATALVGGSHKRCTGTAGTATGDQWHCTAWATANAG